VLTGIVVPVVAYVLAPRLGRLLHGWLYAGSELESAKRVREGP
jgi:antibiotic biosynthesis monooxygenase (ABM) superfamily enzyme